MELKKSWNKILIVLVSFLVILGSLFVTFDERGKSITEASLQEAIVVFGIAKGLNGAISLAQGTEVGPPGLTLSIGEVLDPINDLVEQFSWVMLASITSLGLQKILTNIVTGIEFNVIMSIFIVIINLWLFIRFKNDEKVRNIFFKITIIMIFLRFSIPIMSIANTFVYEQYVKSDYNIEVTKSIIQDSSKEINEITNKTIQEKNSFPKAIEGNPRGENLLDSIRKGLEDAVDFVENVSSNIFSIEYYEKKIQQYKLATDKTSESIINLIIAFVFKTIFFPLVFLFFLYQLLRSIYNIGK